MNPFSDLQKDSVFIVKATGSRAGPYKTALSKDSASIFDASLDVDDGDKLVRTLPNGKEESYTIVQADFSQGLHGIPPHYNLKLTKDSAIKQTASLAKHTTIHINHSTGVQVGDHNTVNIQNALTELIQRIEQTGATGAEKEEAKSRLSAFLAHPLVTSILGGAVGGLTKLL